MAKNFGNAGSAKAFENTKKTEAEKARVIALQNISTENLIDNPKNGEDITMTSDLEESMRQNGFTDPMEVTDFGMPEGKYMILSGHRRRAAGVKVGITVFPCVVRHFKTEQEVQNYTLMANSQRDSAKDPCLFCIRYKMHEEYLMSVGFDGSIRLEVAKRLGLSPAQADRYNTMNKIIMPVWDMVRGEVVGMSSVQPMATYNEAAQEEIYDIMQDALKHDVSLTRETVKTIIEGYQEGKRTWAEIADLPRDSGMTLNGFMNTDNGVTREPKEPNRNDEVRRERDPVAEAYDESDAAQRAWEEEHASDADEHDEGVADTKPSKPKNEKKAPTPEERQVQLGNEIVELIETLDTKLNMVWKCEDNDKAKAVIGMMEALCVGLIGDMHRVTEEIGDKDSYTKIAAKLKRAVDEYSNN